MKTKEEIESEIKELQTVLDSLKVEDDMTEWDADIITIDRKVIKNQIEILKWVLK